MEATEIIMPNSLDKTNKNSQRKGQIKILGGPPTKAYEKMQVLRKKQGRKTNQEMKALRQERHRIPQKLRKGDFSMRGRHQAEQSCRFGQR